MTDKEINEAIAIYFGYRKKIGYIDANGKIKGEWSGPDGYTYDEIPDDYCGDLNAMHEAEKYLLKMDNSLAYWETYSNRLVAMLGATDIFHATARQRAEAFLKAIEKWQESRI